MALASDEDQILTGDDAPFTMDKGNFDLLLIIICMGAIYRAHVIAGGFGRNELRPYKIVTVNHVARGDPGSDQ